MRDNMRMKKVLSILLCLCIVLSYVPMPALAEEITCTHHVHEGCTFDPSTCADCAVITNQPADWCGNSLCSQEDNAHAPGCAWYVRTYEECKCVLSCSEEGLNDYCETCYFEGVDACGGEEEAIVFTDFEISDGRLIKYNGSGGNITIPETVTSIDVYAFDGCSSLESVTIPGSVTTIWNYAFRNCTNLRSVTISGSVETINSYAFLGCSSLQSVTISGSVTTIGNHVFNACSNLRSLTISGSVTTIENYAFNGCSGLEEITISGSVTTIVNNAFNGCTGLTTVNVPCNWENSLYNFGDNVNVQKADHSFGTDGKCICGAECSHSYDAEGKCTVCNCVGGIIDVSTLTSDLKITATGYSMNGKSYLYEGDYTLTGTTSHGVFFEAGEYQLTANNLKIVKGDSYTGSAIELKNGATLHLVLTGDNTLTGGWEGSGIRVNEGTSLTISGDGILRAGYQQGGNAAYGAAIGGYCNSNFGTITINGGTIYATGGGGASIGSGSLYGSSNTMAGTIVLNGGTIYADLIGNARSSGAVLKGSGAKVYCDSIRADTTGLNEIVYSKDGTSATYYCNDFIVTGDVANCSWDQTNKVLNINGGTVTVSNADKNAATSQRIYIQGTANVTLNGVNISTTTGAPIEIRDYNDTNVTLTLSGNNTLISQTANKAAIHKTRGQQATSSNAATLTINGSGSLTAVGGSNAAGIGGGGHRGDTHNIIINSGTISATGKGWAAGIGSSDDGSTWNIVVNGGNVTANGVPGIGANTDNWQGVKDASITGGMVTTNSYKGSTPTGGLVSTDGGKNHTVYGDHTLDQDLQIAPDGKLTVMEGETLTIASGKTLTNRGIIENRGTIVGNLDNQGVIYNMGTLPAGTAETIHEQYVSVENGSGTGNYTEGSTVTITADAPASGMMFTGWTIELGTITLTDSTKAETTFTMPEGCVIVKANYADIVATVTDSNGNVKYYSDEYFAQNEWYNAGGTLTLYTDIRPFHLRIPANGVLDLNRHTMQTDMLIIDQSCTIQNGTISIWHEGIVEEDAVVTFKNVTITNDEHGSWEVEITNDGTIIDEGLTLNGVIISGGSVKTGLTEERVTLSDIPTEGYVYDGTAHEPGVKCGETTLVAGTDYTVTFSNSNGGNSTVNAGTITMTVTGKGNYAGTVTKTYTIGKADPSIGAVTAGVVNDTLEISAIVLNRENTNVAGALTVDADQTIVLGQNQIKYTFVPVDTTNYKTVTGTMTVTVTDTVAPVIGGIDNGKTYYTTQVVAVTDKNIDTITLNGEAVTSTITLEGDKEATYTIVATDKAGNSTTVIVKMAPIADITESMEGMTSENVTSDDKAALQTIVDTVTELLKDEELPTEEKEALEKVKADAEALLKVIEDADKAADTENTDKVEGVTADNVTPEDKSDLEKAKADLEKALKDNGGNYTEDEKKAIEDELKRIDDALKVIENVEAVENAVSNLPATVEPDDEETVAKIEAAKKSYNELTDYEKSLVDPETKEKLDKLTNGIVAYDIVKGDGSSWTKGTDGSITFTVNGPISKCSGIKIDGKAVDAQHYDVKAGSTIITLKASYLETLAAGEHSITVVYTDGETSGTFDVQAKSTTPATGDNSHLMLWFSLMIVSCAAILILLNCKRIFSYGGKYSK